MRSTGYSIALIGATGVVGREILTALEDRDFPVAELAAYASLRTAGEQVTCGGVTARVDPLGDAAQFHDVDIAFLAVPEQVSAEWAGRIAEAGAVVIDLSGLFALDPEIPLVVPEVNPDEIGRYVERSLISSPDPVSIAVAVALAPLYSLAPIQRLVLTALEPVSGAGAAGIEELGHQTLDLMNGRSVEEQSELPIFPRRIAFNVIPQVGELLEGSVSRREQQVAANLRRILDAPDLPVSVTSVRVPLFYGTSVTLNVETDGKLPLEGVRDALRQAPGVLLQDDAIDGLYPTPADVVGQDATCVGRIREDPSQPVFDLWLGIDNARKGAAVNAVQIAEILIRDYL